MASRKQRPALGLPITELRRSVHITNLLTLIWGTLYALFLQNTKTGQYLAQERTYLTVVAGVGVDLLIARPAMDRKSWNRMATIIALSSIPLIIRSVTNELARDPEIKGVGDYVQALQPPA